MAELIFSIAAYAAIGLRDRDSDVLWPQPGDAAVRSPVPNLLRRRLTPIGQAALRAAWALPRLEDARFIFASRHGEFDRSLTMLQHLAAGENPSPADFSLGVHNALAGLLSIAARNQAGHTALAAGVDSFGFGLMEAAAGLIERPDQPSILVYFDPELPAGYPDPTPVRPDPALALAVLVVPPRDAPRQIAMTATPAAFVGPYETAAGTFLHFLRTAAPRASATGESMRWDWRHV